MAQRARDRSTSFQCSVPRRGIVTNWKNHSLSPEVVLLATCLTATPKLKGATWNRLLPSLLEVKSADSNGWSLSATKLSFSPLGETFGSAQQRPIRCRSLPLRSILQNASSTPSKRLNTIRDPFGVNDGSCSQTNSFGVNSTMLLPSRFISAMLQKGVSSLSISKTICRPSGDQSGLVASPLTCVICRRSWPFCRTV